MKFFWYCPHQCYILLSIIFPRNLCGVLSFSLQRITGDLPYKAFTIHDSVYWKLFISRASLGLWQLDVFVTQSLGQNILWILKRPAKQQVRCFDLLKDLNNHRKHKNHLDMNSSHSPVETSEMSGTCAGICVYGTYTLKNHSKPAPGVYIIACYITEKSSRFIYN